MSEAVPQAGGPYDNCFAAGQGNNLQEELLKRKKLNRITKLTALLVPEKVFLTDVITLAFLAGTSKTRRSTRSLLLPFTKLDSQQYASSFA